jgi:hypothetical protein
MDRKHASVNKTIRQWRTLAAMLAMALGLFGIAATPVRAADVLILSTTVTGGTSSVEYTTATALGYTVDLVAAGPGAGTWPTPPQPYSAYKAIILGDPSCGSSTSIAAAEANSAGVSGWAAAVTGNVVIIGTDPTYHKAQGGAQLWKSAIGFAAAGPGTGAVIALSCYYNSALSGTTVPVLKGFESTGTFAVQGGVPCLGDVSIVAASPALTGLTGGPGGTLSAWSCSVHEGFNSWDPSFIPLAVATDVPPGLKTYPKSEPIGFPYILARGKTLVPVDDGGILKVCKVAGLGIKPGTSYSFTAGSSTFTVPAGPGPGGYCVVGPTFPVGTSVTVSETIPPGNVVSSIAVAPPGQLVGAPNLAGGSVNVTIGSGVTEVTFTDKHTGFVEICKAGRVTGNFSFTVNPGGLGPVVVPAGACSSAVEVAAGAVVIHEMTTPTATMAGCGTIPASRQGLCDTAGQNSTVTVVPGDVSTMTIAFIVNRPKFAPGGILGAVEHTHALAATTTTFACAPAPAPTRGSATCTARVTAADPKTGVPTGVVGLTEGDTTLATVQLNAEGTAVFNTSSLAAGVHRVVATYSGDTNFEASGSQPVSVTVERP